MPTGKTISSLFGLFFALAASLLSAELPVTPIFPFPAVQIEGAHELAGGDFDQDGYPDIATLSTDGGVYILRGLCDGSLEIASRIPLAAPIDLESADFDLDGDLDLVVIDNPMHRTVFLVNQGDGSFREGLDYPLEGIAWELVVTDFNGDGKPDVAVAVVGQGPSLHLYLSTPISFLYSTRHLDSGAPRLNHLAAADINGDGAPDLALAHIGQVEEISGESYYLPAPVTFLLNQGDGTFGSPQFVTRLGCNVQWLGLSDFDHDGDGDLVALYWNTLNPFTFGQECDCHDCAILYENNDQEFSISGVISIDRYTEDIPGAALLDTDQDGQQEVIFSTILGHPDEPIATPILPINDDLTFGSVRGGAIEFGASGFVIQDAGLDGQLDLFIVGGTSVAVHSLQANGDPLQTIAFREPRTNRAGLFITGHLDGNDLDDALLNDGYNLFSYLQIAPNVFTFANSEYLGTVYQIQVADLDHTGLPEIIAITDQQRSVSIYSQSPAPGQLILRQRFEFANAGPGLLTADFDRDGDLDLASLEPYVEYPIRGALYLLENRGTGYFDLRSQISVAGGANGFAVLDVNLDQLPDVALANGGPEVYEPVIEIYQSVSPWRFKLSQSIRIPNAAKPSGYGNEIAAVDLDGRGSASLLIADAARGVVMVFKNDGTGRFYLSQEAPAGYGPQQLYVRDLDGDRLEDVIVRNVSSAFSVLRNRWTGVLDPSESFFLSPLMTNYMHVSDLDDDAHAEITVLDRGGFSREFMRSTEAQGDWDSNPVLTWNLNSRTVRQGDPLRLSLTVRGARKISSSDVYIAVFSPAGLLSYLTQLGFQDTAGPWATDSVLTACQPPTPLLQIDAALPVDLPVGVYELIGVAIVPGSYELLDAATTSIEVVP